MRKALGLITLLLSLFSCGNRTKQEYSTIVVEKNVEETYKHHDTDNIEVIKGRMNNTEAQSTHVPSSSSHSQKSRITCRIGNVFVFSHSKCLCMYPKVC